jgi:hypothetical protein
MSQTTAKYEKRADVERRIELLAFTRPELALSKSYYQKAIVYGKYVEYYEYDTNLISHKETHRIAYRRTGEHQRRQSSLSRARQEIYRIVEANVGRYGAYRPVFFTLTFRRNETELKKTNRKYKYFITKLNEYVGHKVKYIVVPEFQKRGAVHYHGVFFNLPYLPIETFKKLWSNGSVDLQVTRKFRSVGAYISKYLSKDMFDKRLFNQKAYFTSRGIYRPIHIFGSIRVSDVLTDDMIEIEHYEKHNCKYIKYARRNIRDSLAR